MIHIQRPTFTQIATLSLLSALSQSGCSSLWNGFTTGDPSSCVNTPTLCSQTQVCNRDTGMCEASTVSDYFSYTGINPSMGKTGGGDAVDLRGTGFTTDTVVKIAGQPLVQPMVQGNGTVIHGLTPVSPGRCGPVNVEVNRTGFPAALHPAEFLYKFEPYHNAPPFALANLNEEVLQIAQAEFTGDRFPDLIVSSLKTLYFVSNNAGAAGPAENTGLLFSKPIRFSVGAFQLPGRTAAAIVDPNTNALLFVNTVSSFTPAYNNGTVPKDVATINLDAVGTDEVVIYGSNTSSTNYYLTPARESATGNVSAGSTVNLGGSPLPAMAVLDITGDGFPDVVLGGATSTSLVYAKSTGSFGLTYAGAPAITLPVGVSSLVAADWDRDGKTDLAALGTDGRVFFLKNQGNGSLIKIDEQPTTIKSAGGVTEPGPPMQAYDVNCDGLLDLILGPSASGSPINNITIFLNDGQGHYPPKQTLQNTGGSFLFTDLNQDTLPDFVMRDPVLQRTGLNVAMGSIP